jgi:hypothetical protein
MIKRLLVCFGALLFLFGLEQGSAKGKEGSWTGWVTDTHCGAKGDNSKHADCAKKCVKQMGAKFALYTPADKKVNILDPQDKVAEHAGHHVKVKGALEGDTIKLTSIEMTGEQKGHGEKPKG